MKRNTLFILLCFFSFLGFWGMSEEPSATDKLKDTFLGLTLGSSSVETLAIIKKADLKLIGKEEEKGNIVYAYYGNHQIKGAKITMLIFWKDKLSMVAVVFEVENDQSDNLYEALKKKIEDKFGKMKDEIEFAGKKAELEKDGMGISINMKKNPFKPAEIRIGAVHLGIYVAQKNEDIQKKADNIGNF